MRSGAPDVRLHHHCFRRHLGFQVVGGRCRRCGIPLVVTPLSWGDPFARSSPARRRTARIVRAVSVAVAHLSVAIILAALARMVFPGG